MSDLQLFAREGLQLRTLPAADDRPELFCAADLCAMIAHSDPTRAVRDNLDADEYRTMHLRDVEPAGRPDSERVSTAVPGRGPQRLLMVTESGAWTLVLVSDAPNARAVRKWLARDVLPALRARGGYALPDVNAHLVATLLSVRTALDVHGESDTRHAEHVIIQEGPLNPDERERQLREVAALDAARRMLDVELRRWSGALPPDTPIPLPAAVVRLAEHLRATTRRGGRPAPELPDHVDIVDDERRPSTEDGDSP